MESEKETAGRTRTFSWEDPKALAEAARGLTGLEFLRKVVSGELPRPPISALMNFGLAELEEGRAVFTVEPAGTYLLAGNTGTGTVVVFQIDPGNGTLTFRSSATNPRSSGWRGTPSAPGRCARPTTRAS